jgi:hypothetical protein
MSSSDPGQEGIQPPGAPRPAASRPRRAPGAEPAAPPPVPAERLTTFIGQSIVERRRLPIMGWLWLLAAITFLVLFLVHRVPGLFAGGFLGSAAFALAYLLWRPRPQTLQFTEEGIDLGPPQGLLPYSRVQEVFAPDQRSGRGSFPIYLLCDQGTLKIAASRVVDSQELYRFLVSQPLGGRTLPTVDPMFRDFLRQQQALHGAGSIYVYQARSRAWDNSQRRDWRWNSWRRLALALALCSGFWLIALSVARSQAGLAGQLEFLYGLTPAAAVCCVLFFLISLIPRGQVRVPKRLQQSTLIISPGGLALSQGALQGELRWTEVRGLKTRTGTSFALSRTDVVGPGIHLQVSGASIFVADIYHWPIEHITKVICEYAEM